MDAEEKIAFIAARRRFGMIPGLGRMERLLKLMGNPSMDAIFVHIAGTNGKGSVAAILSSVLKESLPFAVGRFTSPHLVSFSERIAIGGAPVSRETLMRAVDAVLPKIAQMDGEGTGPTFFECATAIAFEAFRLEGVKVIVLEAGLGGRLDATNVVTPLFSVITNVGLEHCEHLGDTIGAVAGEKAGIIKPGRPVLLGNMDPEALGVMERRARQAGAQVIRPQVSILPRRRKGGARLDVEDGQRTLTNVAFPLEGAFQYDNLSLAVAAAELFSSLAGTEISDSDFKRGLEEVRWPCRYQLVHSSPAVIVDGAHNPPAFGALAKSLSSLKGPKCLVCGFCADKDHFASLSAIAPLIGAAWATETPSERTARAAELAKTMERCSIRTVNAEPDWRKALEGAMSWARERGGTAIVAGSLFLAGAVAERFGKAGEAESVDLPNEATLKAGAGA